MAEQTALEAAQAATVKAQRQLNNELAHQKRARSVLRASQFADRKPFSKAVNLALAEEMKIRRALAKAEAKAEAADDVIDPSYTGTERR